MVDEMKGKIIDIELHQKPKDKVRTSICYVHYWWLTCFSLPNTNLQKLTRQLTTNLMSPRGKVATTPALWDVAVATMLQYTWRTSINQVNSIVFQWLC
jgi:hypothetical protein